MATRTPETPQVISFQEKTSGERGGKIPLAEINNLPPYLSEIGRELSGITGTWDPVTIYQPTNVDDEKVKFIANYKRGDVSNPYFEYGNAAIEGLDDKEERIRKIASGLKNHDGVDRLSEHEGKTTRLERLARAALYYKIRDDLATVNLIRGLNSRDEKKIKDAMKNKYPGILRADGSKNEFLVSLARQAYEYHTDKQTASEARERAELSVSEIDFLENNEIFGAKEYEEAIKWMLGEYGALYSDDNPAGLRVIVTDEVSSITVQDKRVGGAAVLIPKDRKTDGKKFLYNLSHEVEGHGLQTLNGQALFLGLGGGALKVDDEMLYEGLGIRYQNQVLRELFGETTPMPKPYYTYSILAAEEGKSFYEIFDQNVDMHLHERLKIPPDVPIPDITTLEAKDYEWALNESWRITYRVMRGHADTTNPEGFAMSKDLVYLNGYAIDQELVEHGLGYLNDSGIIATGALQMLAELDMTEDDIPYKNRNLVREYYYKILRPKLPIPDPE